MTEAAEEQTGSEQQELFVFEDVVVEKAYLSVLGASSLELAEDQVLEHGEEVELVFRGIVQASRIVTKNRGDRDGGRKQTTVTRVVKVDELKSIKVRPQLKGLKDV
jgi:hypothetical protein